MAKQTESAPPTTITAEVVCIGPCFLVGNKPAIELALIERKGAINIPGRSLTYSQSKAFAGVRAGFVYSAEFRQLDEEHAIIIPTSLRYQRVFDNPESVLRWQAMETAHHITQRAKKAQRHAQATREVLERLKPLRAIYQRTDRLTKLALEVQLLDYLRHGVVPSGNEEE